MAVIYTLSAVFYSDDFQPPVQKGSAARTERLVPNSASNGSSAGTLVANETESVIDIYTQEDLWYKIGSGTPTAQAEGSTSRFLAAGERAQHGIQAGEKLAVIGT